VHQFRIHDPAGPDPHFPPSPARDRGDGATDGRWSISSCYLIGTDGRPARGAWKQVGDTIYAKPANDTPIGLALLVDAGAAGRLVLQTCFLPAREKPYDLFIEIARSMIKQFVEECETWQMWNPALAKEAIELWESARATFREALRCDDPLEAERIARRSIAYGLDAGEALALRHARHLLARRARRKGVSSTTLGVCIDPATPPTPAISSRPAQSCSSRSRCAGPSPRQTPWSNVPVGSATVWSTARTSCTRPSCASSYPPPGRFRGRP
jgi:hypothetical protein